MIGQHARGLQGLEWLARHARGLQLQAQRHRAAGRSRRQRCQHLEGLRCVTIFERPLGGQQSHRFFGTVTSAPTGLQGLAQGGIAPGAILQPVQAARGHELGEDAELGVVTQLWRLALDRQRALGRLRARP